MPVEPKDLPAIESLDATSDFTVFMRPGVPLEVRNQALRKLWRSDPVLANLDGLLEYGEDYSLPSWPKDAIRTAYQVGRGFIEQISESAETLDQARSTDSPGTRVDEAPGSTAETPAEREPRIAAAPPELSPGEAAPPRDADFRQEGPARAAIQRRRVPRRS